MKARKISDPRGREKEAEPGSRGNTFQGYPMERRNRLDAIDRSILRILSTYHELTPLQLWYEMGEDDAVKETLTDAEVLSRLESLKKKGFVETVRKQGVDADSSLPLYRVKASDEMTDKDQNK